MSDMPAFPEVRRGEGKLKRVSGMTLRDYIATKALAALIAGRSWGHIKDDEQVVRAWALAAYKTADAMLEEREA